MSTTYIYILYSLVILKNYRSGWCELLLAPISWVAILNNEFFFDCELRVPVKDISKYENIPLQFQGLTTKCNVTNWKFCNIPFPQNPSDGACGCLSKSVDLHYNTFVYMLTFYRTMMTTKYQGAEFFCKLGDTLEEKKRIDVYGFKKSPGPTATVCEGHNLTFNWEFQLNFDFKNSFTVKDVMWKLQELELARCFFKNSASFQCSRKADRDFSLTTPMSNEIPKLIFQNVPKEMKNAIMTITLTLILKTGDDLSETNETAANKEEFKRSADYVDYQNYGNDSYPIIEGPSSSTSTTTTTTTVTTTTTTTTPKPVNMRNIKKTTYVLTDSTRLAILEPPSDNLDLEFTGAKTLSGQIIVSCEMRKTAALGSPPINMTIWHNDKIIVTRENTHLLRYMITAAQGNLTCGIAGDSAICLNRAHRESEIMQISEIQPEETQKKSINIALFLYCFEVFSCLILMTWTITQMVEHMRNIMDRQRRALEIELQLLSDRLPGRDGDLELIDRWEQLEQQEQEEQTEEPDKTEELEEEA